MFNNFLIRATLLCLLFLISNVCVSAAPGDLDTSFGNGGVARYRLAQIMTLQMQ